MFKNNDDALVATLASSLNLDSSIGRARVGRWRRDWVGRKPRLKTCLRTFGRQEPAMPLAWLRPARATTTRATARKEEQRPQAHCQRLNRVRSAATQWVNPIEAEKNQYSWGLRDAEITNIPFLAALAGALRRCNPLV